MATPIAAGRFGPWLQEVHSAIGGDGVMDVPCGSCTGCCQAAQFVHIEPDETDTLAVIPAELLFPAPRLPRGHVLMGYDEHGRCPMLADGGCTIYEHRPRTCRTYDCRVFAATGVEPDPDTQAAVAERVRRWRFDVDEHDAPRLDALRAAAVEVRRRPDAPGTPLGVAIAAIRTIS
jgi:uncharacterized protein